MLTIKCVSEKRCFICGSSERTAEVQFSDKTFKGVLCLQHIYEKLRPERAEAGRVAAPTNR